MTYIHVIELPTGNTSLEVSLDDKCAKFWLQHVTQGKSCNLVHYLNRNQVEELRDYLNAMLMELDMTLLELECDKVCQP